MATRTPPRPKARKRPTGGGPSPWSAAGRADRTAHRARAATEAEKLRKARRAKWARRRRTTALVFLTIGTLFASAGRGAVKAARFARKHHGRAWQRTRSHVVDPAGKWLRWRVVVPFKMRRAAWGEDIAAFGWFSGAQDCPDCVERVPRRAWNGHQEDAHGHEPSRSWRRPADPTPAMARELGGFTWQRERSPLSGAWRALAVLFDDLRDGLRERFTNWTSCVCGWSGDPTNLHAHLQHCRGRIQPGDKPGQWGTWGVSQGLPDDVLTPADTSTTPAVGANPSTPVIPVTSRRIPVSQPREGVAGADIVTSNGDQLQVHDLPPLLNAGKDHSMAEAEWLAAALQRAVAAGGDSSVAEALARALAAQIGVGESLGMARDHAERIAAQTPDYRETGQHSSAAAAVSGAFDTNRLDYRISDGVVAMVTDPRLQVHDVPLLMRDVDMHVQANTESLIAAYERIAAAEGVDRTMSQELGRAATLQEEVRRATEDARAAAESLAAVAPNFRDGQNAVGAGHGQGQISA